MPEIKLATDFTRYPGGRFSEDGPHSGQLFRTKFLLGPLREGKRITVDLDDVAGLPASFLEEAFGGLVRDGIPKADVQRLLLVKARSARLSRYPALVWRYVDEAEPAV